MAMLSCKEKVMQLIILEKHGFGQWFLEQYMRQNLDRTH